MNMKKVISGEKLYTVEKEAIKLLCDTVKVTLGPKGENVIIDHSNHQPYITNDGVTIARNIESDDPIINTVLTIAKEASLSTDENVGDGTTTTLVLLESIFLEGISLIESGKNPIVLKRELDEALNTSIALLEGFAVEPDYNILQNVATLSSNDSEIGSLVFKAFDITRNLSAINLIESDNEGCISVKKGYSFASNIASDYFFSKAKNIAYNNANIIISDEFLDDIHLFDIVLNDIIAKREPLIIIASDFSDSLINEALSLYLYENIDFILLKAPEYGLKQHQILKDLCAIAKTELFSSAKISTIYTVGHFDSISITEEEVTVSFLEDKKILSRLEEIGEESKNDPLTYNRVFYDKRCAMLSQGIVDIYISANSITERREKKMRYVDALSAINSAQKGVVLGGGNTYLRVSKNINPRHDGDRIIKHALRQPFIQILTNAGIDSDFILSHLKDADFSQIYNVKNDLFEDIQNTSIWDSLEVLTNALKSAVSIASMLITTSSMVVNEFSPSLNVAPLSEN